MMNTAGERIAWRKPNDAELKPSAHHCSEQREDYAVMTRFSTEPLGAESSKVSPIAPRTAWW